MSSSNSSQIRLRAYDFCIKNPLIFPLENRIMEDLNISPLIHFLNNEYSQIPEKERIGKGAVYITRYVSLGIWDFFEQENRYQTDSSSKVLLNYCNFIFHQGCKNDQIIITDLAVFLVAELLKRKPQFFQEAETTILSWANNEKWEVREIATAPIVGLLQKHPSSIVPTLKIWAISPNENIRRLVSESTRPHAETKWLRDPKKNQEIIEILSLMRADPSEYVRKSVGNNLKDLSKYMPKEILHLLADWVTNARITVTPDLVTKSKKELGTDHFYLVWTMKHALRWLHDKNPEYHLQIEQILGSNYINYYHEKKNKSARPVIEH